jgi:hypothetical protein
MDSVIITLVFISWLAVYDTVERMWKAKQHRFLLVGGYAAYMFTTYMIGLYLTKLF